MIIFTNSTTKHLNRQLADAKINFGQVLSKTFADNEIYTRIKTRVKRKSTAIIASINHDYSSLIDLLAIHRLLKENMAKTRYIIIPYFGYARQDRMTQEGEGSIGVLFAEMIRNVNPTKILTVDIHSPLVKKGFGVACADLTALPILADYFADKNYQMVVAPDKGAAERAECLSRLLGSEIDAGHIDKIRPSHDVAKALRLHGNVKDKNVLIVDDMISTGGTIEQAVKLLKKEGAAKIAIAATHGVFAKNAKTRLAKLPVEEIVVTNTLFNQATKKIKVLDISPVIKEAILK